MNNSELIISFGFALIIQLTIKDKPRIGLNNFLFYSIRVKLLPEKIRKRWKQKKIVQMRILRRG